MPIHTLTRAALEEIAFAADLDPDQFRGDYSGRGMFGRQCFGVVGSVRDVQRFGVAAEQVLGEDAEQALFGQPIVDSMGRDFIWYWPGTRLEQAPARPLTEGCAPRPLARIAP